MGQLLFKKIFFDAIRDGTKRTTIRRWRNARLKAGGRAFAPGLGWLAIESVEILPDLSRLDDDDARADGFDSADAMRAMLRSIYPEQADGRQWFRVAFRAESSAKDAPAPIAAREKSRSKSSRPPDRRRAAKTRRRKRIKPT